MFLGREEQRLDLRIPDPERSAEGIRTVRLVQKINQADQLSEEYPVLVRELFSGGFGAGSVVTKDVAPNTVVAGNPARVIRMLDTERF